MKSAYASLYALQFRYEFLEGYAHKEEQNRALTPDESDEMAKAKNRFGELLGLLKMDQFHEVHSAFSNVVQSQISDVTKLEVYRYGILSSRVPAKSRSLRLRSSRQTATLIALRFQLKTGCRPVPKRRRRV